MDRPIYHPSADKKGIQKIIDIFISQTDGFMTYQQVIETYNCKISWLDYAAIIKGIPLMWKNVIINTPVREDPPPLSILQTRNQQQDK